MNMTKIRNTSILVVFAVLTGLLLFWVWGSFQNKTVVHSDKAFMPNIETLAESSVIVIKGKIVDEGKVRNLRRDKEDPRKEASTVKPGTDYSVQIEEVLKGDLPTGSLIQVAIEGGDYKGKSKPLEASVNKNKSYYFFLIPSSMGAPYYFGAGEPFIFGKVGTNMRAVSNNKEFKKVFKDDGLIEDEFVSKIKLK